jgi:N utilization substance protein B
MARGSRHQGRVAALQALYEADNSGHLASQALGRIVAGQRVPADSAAFAKQLLEGVLAQQDEIDQMIARTATAWPIQQLPAVDRNIIRLAIWELLQENATPVNAVISEAVELAKQFGSENSAKFVNGVLGSIERRRQEADPNQATAQRR